MRLSRLSYLIVLLMAMGMFSCKNKPAKTEAAHRVYKGLYSFGSDAKTFKDCANGHEFWVADSSAQLELKYSQLISFEKTGEPVYVEVEGNKVLSAKDGPAAMYDTTFIVKKVLKITTDIPAGNCKL